MHELVFPWWWLLGLHIASPIDLAHRTRKIKEIRKKMKIFAVLLCAVVSGQHWSYGWHPGKNRNWRLKYHAFFSFSRQTKPSSSPCWRGCRSTEFIYTPVADCTVDFRKFYFYHTDSLLVVCVSTGPISPQLRGAKFSVIECIFSYRSVKLSI